MQTILDLRRRELKIKSKRTDSPDGLSTINVNKNLFVVMSSDLKTLHTLGFKNATKKKKFLYFFNGLASVKKNGPENVYCVPEKNVIHTTGASVGMHFEAGLIIGFSEKGSWDTKAPIKKYNLIK